MRKILFVAAAVAFCINFAFAQTSADFPPSWTKKLPKSGKKIYATGYGASVSEQIAFEKAKVQAFKELADQLGKIAVKSSKGKTNVTTQAVLTEVEIVDKASKQDSTGRYEAYILVSHPKPKKK